MQQKTGKCIQCEQEPRLINSKGVCPDCIFLNKYGKSRQEVYLERKLERERGKPKKIYTFKRKPLKTSKKRPKVHKQLRDERLEKRREQIRLDEVTYEEVFNSKPSYCEECYLKGINTPLPDEFRDEEEIVIFKTQYSHIMTKGAYKEFRNDKRNFNRLCADHHHQWEFGDREKMKIYSKNQEIIQELLNERNNEK